MGVLLLFVIAVIVILLAYNNPYKENLEEQTYVDNNGYLRYSDTGRLVHRYVASKKLSRKLRPMEVVHHIDGNKLNNHPTNLWVFPNQAQHHALHMRQRKRNRDGKK